MFDERDLMVRDMYIEERLAEAAHERLLLDAMRERRLRAAERGRQRAGARAALLLRVGHLLVHIGQRLESLASAEPLMSTPAIRTDNGGNRKR